MGRELQNFNRAKDRLVLLAPIALGIICVLLVVAYGRVSYMIVTVLRRGGERGVRAAED